MQKTEYGLHLSPLDVGSLIARLRKLAIAAHKIDPDLTAEVHRIIDELERGVGDVVPGVDVEVRGGTVWKRHAYRVKNGLTLTTMVGELDGVKAYCRERDGRMKVIVSKEDLYE